MKLFAAALFLVLFLGACSTAPKITATPTGLKAADFWKEQASRTDETNPVSGKMSMRYRTKKQSLAGKGRIIALLPSKARLELRDPLGRVAYLISMDGPNVVAYYPTQKRAFVDDKGGAAYLREFLGLDVAYVDLQSLLVGTLPNKKRAFDHWDWDGSKGFYKGVIKEKDRTTTAWVDGHTAALREVRFDLSSDVVDVKFSEFEPCCGAVGRLGNHSSISLANTVALELQRAQTGVEVHWQDIEKIDKSKLPETFKLSLPDDVQKTVLK